MALILPDADIPAMNLHLQAISTHVKKDSHAAMIIDGAGWHKEGDKLCVPNNITLIRLPCPNYLAGKVFDTYEDIVDGCCAAWNALIATPGKIKSIASRDWLRLPQVSY